MPDAAQWEQSLLINLTDAGCSDELIQQCMALWKENRRKEVLPLLEKHRRYLLECYRADGKKIDRLDFLLYQLKKKENTEGTT